MCLSPADTAIKCRQRQDVQSITITMHLPIGPTTQSKTLPKETKLPVYSNFLVNKLQVISLPIM